MLEYIMVVFLSNILKGMLFIMEEILKNLLGTHWGAMAAKILPVVAIIIIGYFLINFIIPHFINF